jgi:hypothetical protein
LRPKLGGRFGLFGVALMVLAISLTVPVSAAKSPVISSSTGGTKCFVVVPSGSLILSQSQTTIVVRFVNGSTVVYSSSPNRSTTTRACTATEGQAPTINGWIEDASNSVSSSYTYMTDQWPVPLAPSSGSGAYGGPLTYLFNGIQNSAPIIYQPVLAYGCETGNFLYCSMGGAYWWISAESCNTSCTSTTPIKVSVGDSITGTVVSDSTYCSPNVAYDITIDDTTSGHSATLKSCASAGYGALGVPAALEAYNIGSCSNLPNEGGGMTFGSISSTPTQSHAWTININTVSPSCSYGMSSSAGSVTLFFT